MKGIARCKFNQQTDMFMGRFYNKNESESPESVNQIQLESMKKLVEISAERSFMNVGRTLLSGCALHWVR